MVINCENGTLCAVFVLDGVFKIKKNTVEI